MLEASVISAINGVHDAFLGLNHEFNLDLPQIAVLGSQSSGKSSVLETIVGYEFLPRGRNIVTRCPLLLKLLRAETPFGEFAHKKGTIITRFSEIREEIQRQTNVLAGPTGVSSQPISLTVGAPHIVPLTLVDLPGIVAHAVEGQSQDMPAKIEEMVLKIISSPNTIVLFVCEANHDIATNLALRLLSKADPEGSRTVGVLTKMDLVPPGEDAMDVITGRIGRLRHGYVPVVNRSQAQGSLSLKQAVEEEKTFFKNHPAYSAIASKCGSEYLAKTLSRLLVQHIQAQLPRLEATLDGLEKRAKNQLASIGGSLPAMEPRSLVLRLIKSFDDDLVNILGGTVSLNATHLVGGARLHHVFNENFAKFINSLTVTDLSDDVIRNQLCNSSGMHSPLFPSEHVVRCLAARQVRRLEEPSCQCVQAIRQELSIILRSCSPELQRFPTFRETVLNLCDRQLETYVPSVLEHVKVFIEAEAEFVTLVTSAPVVSPPPAGVNPPSTQAPPANAARRPLTAAEARVDVPRFTPAAGDSDSMLRQIRTIVEDSFKATQRLVAQQVPKIIGLLLVMRFRRDLHELLIRELYNHEDLENLLTEAVDVLRQRRSAEAVLEAIAKSRKSLRGLRI